MENLTFAHSYCREKKNDQFTGTTLDEKWQNYVENINSLKEEFL
ncbi:hypothetical protein HMPREF0765_2032 [Sphingobacterium spiritivorum ATCC 33300]|uniref:Uncharacterized protein n=1 Tax=Sphingobacterium spiritivorum ATCC 33300 TaxID=525372 RepID=C2FXH6_SPHSI|nr:hypothetical protein [Sphingobacterium spiritivorum]EEI92417.1 hypothetical protein HMPREF0765_2032 [Sphingobacterium spiritivorum ATCC 33300]